MILIKMITKKMRNFALKRPFSVEKSKTNSSVDSSEAGYKWNYKIHKKKTFPVTNWVIILLPVVLFLSLGIYFILVDLKVISSVLHLSSLKKSRNSTEITWPQDFEVSQSDVPSSGNLPKDGNKETATTGPSLVTESTASSVKTGEIKETIVDDNAEEGAGDEVISATDKSVEKLNQIQGFENTKANRTVIVLERKDNATVFVLGREKTLRTNATTGFNKSPEEFLEVVDPPDVSNSTGNRFDLGERIRIHEEIIVGNTSFGAAVLGPTTTSTTTERPFVYSPTIPQISSRGRLDATTAKNNQSEDVNCFSTKLTFCEGVQPYDMVQMPNLPNIRSYSDLERILPYFRLILDSECSKRAREFICSVLEPECKPSGFKQSYPCKMNCKVVAEDCKHLIIDAFPLSKIFDCSRYPDWDENQDCVNFSKGDCYLEEFQCPDGTCIPGKWRCDGIHDCPGSRPGLDEVDCPGCTENEFRCIMDGRCIPQAWKCDGAADCPDESDEISC